jgi:hypothetical protein
MTNATTITPRQAIRDALGSYNDRNDGFLRSYFSRSKRNHSRNTKAGKVKRVKAPWKV